MNLITQGGERGALETLQSGRFIADPLQRPERPSYLDPNHLLALLRRHLRVMLLVAAAAFLVVLIPALAQPRMYQATALVVLDQRQAQITPSEAVLSALPDTSNAVDTEVEILKSRELAEHVMDRLNLDADPEFGGDPTAAAAADARFRSTGGRAYDSEEQTRRSAVVDAIAAGLNVQRVGLTYVLSVAFQSQSPTKAAKIANAFANQYIAEQLDTKFNARRDANTWLSGKLAQMEGEVQRAEAAVQQYKIEHNLISSSGETLTEQEVSQYSQQMTDARTQEAEAEARLAAAQNELARDPMGDAGGALDSPLLRELRTKRAEVSAKLADVSARFGAKYPDTVSANRQLADLDAQIQAEIRRVVSDLQAQALVARRRTASIGGSLSSARGNLASSSRASVGLQQLEREADSERSLYEALLTRYKEISSEAGIERADARLASTASVPTAPSSPNMPIILALAVLAALGAATVALAAAELMDTSFGTGEELERRLGIPSLGSIPDLTSIGATEQPHIYIATRPLSAFAEAFRSLRTALLQAPAARAPRTVAIASALPGEGKTIAAVCLAKSAAQAGDKVAVIDCDLRRRRLSTSLGITPKTGLLEVLAGDATLEEALVFDSPTGVAILPLTAGKATAEDVFSTGAMRDLLDELSSRVDLVVLDTAPLLALADTRALVAQVDAIVMLARWRKTPQKAVEHALRLLRGSEGRLAGIMLSQVDMRQQQRQGYGDAAYYSGAYQQYYTG